MLSPAKSTIIHLPLEFGAERATLSEMRATAAAFRLASEQSRCSVVASRALLAKINAIVLFYQKPKVGLGDENGSEHPVKFAFVEP